MNCREEIRSDLFAMQDCGYRDFSSSLITTVDENAFIGVRTPALRSYAKNLYKNDPMMADVFISELPHKYFEENQLHAFIIEQIKDYNKCIMRLEAFLPYVDNWSTCDSMNPKILKTNLVALLEKAKVWISSSHEYTCRYGIGVLMRYFLDERFDPEYPKLISGIHRDEYYVKMMVAWYFATALAKQYDSVIFYVENNVLDKWTHNKAIQKAIESYRVSDINKEYLRTLRRK